jgi:NADH:ubiquinone reductase (H+-translocating)
MQAPEKNIVIVGGGFAGATLARTLQPRLPAGWMLTLISEESYTTFNPMLPEAVGASVFPEHVVAPLREVVDLQASGRFIMGRVVAVDTPARTLVCDTLAGPIRLPYAHLVCAFGSRARLDMLPGMAEHSLPLKTVGDAMEIRNTVLRRLARIELESDSLLRRQLGHFVVIGGGFSGVEVAGELVDAVHGMLRYYPRVDKDEVRITVVQDIGGLLPELPPSLGQSAQRSLERRGVVVRLQERAQEFTPAGVRLTGGDCLVASTVICTVGTRPNALTDALSQAGASLERGRIVTRSDLSIPALPGVWAVGDCAWVINAKDGKPSPPTAQFAVRQARCLANNLLAHIAGQTTAGFSYRARGMMAAIGHMKGVALVFGVPLGGLPAWLLWRAYYLSQMPTLRRKLRIFVEWTWGMLFPVDVTHLRFLRSKDVLTPEPEGPSPACVSSPTLNRQ